MNQVNLRRRQLSGLCGGLCAAVCGAPFAALAQTAETVRVIGLLSPSAKPSLREQVFVESMRDLGWIEGKNLRIEMRRAGNDLARLPALAAELVRLNVDLIVTNATPAVLAAKNATSTIPIVSISADPVANGLVASLRRPGGNITGISMMASGLAGKRLELLQEISPKLKVVAFLAHGADPSHKIFIQEAVDGGRVLGIRVDAHIVQHEGDLTQAFSAMKQQGAQGLLIQPLFINQLGLAPQIIALAAKHRLPAVSEGDGYAEQGGLLFYGPDALAIYRRIAYYADRVLRGAKPADLPVEQPQTFAVVVNLVTAKQLGLKMPYSIMVRATKVIE